ncbi:hypothetical protein [Streptomyces sp. CB01881]|uniref:hypothetical protein n=1 Tax=Streptomyces sp. CB01881 TaxID=2078691 RepID=UPI00129C9490|nr:hypothetical protein [Streptomyces sp. CB01881]
MALRVPALLLQHGVLACRDGFDGWQFLGKADAGVSIHSNQVGRQCVDAVGRPHDGAEIAAYACWDTPSQHFNLGTDGTIRAGGYCLSTKDNGLWNGAAAVPARRLPARRLPARGCPRGGPP